MNRRFLTAVPVAAIVIGVAACGPSGSSSPDSVPSIFTPDASYSAQASAAASAAGKLAVKCEPKDTSVQVWEVKMLTSKTTREAFYTCEAVPKGDDDAVAGCALTAAENAHKASGTSSSKETGFISALAVCVSSLGAASSASSSASATK